MTTGKRFVIVGGVAAGASAAARLRRLDENASIVILEKGDSASYANCGLPYRLGNVIRSRDNLLVTAPEKFRDWFAIDLRCRSEAVAIDRDRQTVHVREASGREYDEPYDTLLLAPGAVPREASVPGADDPAVHHLWTLADMDAVERSLDSGAHRALVVGAGFVGVETAENLAHRGLEVTIVQKSHVLPILDPEMSTLVADELLRSGIALELGCVVERYHRTPDGLVATLSNGRELVCDLAIEGVGVAPASSLAASAGLELGPRGHIRVDEHMRTSDPAIYAAGDAVEVVDSATGRAVAIALAGPANKQGRIAADNMAARAPAAPATYRGGNGTSVVRVGGLTVASAGRTEERLAREGVPHRALYIHPFSNATYFPGAAQMTLKLLFAPSDGAILGCQIVGTKGVDKRIDLISAAMSAGWPAPRLAEAEAAYAPPYGSAKDSVNFAGFVAQNILDGLTDPVSPGADLSAAFVVDVRTPAEYALGAIPGARNLPLETLRDHLDELPHDRSVVAYCQVGVRGYLAERILRQRGFDAHNLSGGYTAWKLFHHTLPPVRRPTAKVAEDPAPKSSAPANATVSATAPVELDVRGLACPGPVMRLTQTISGVPDGTRIHLLAPSTFEGDLRRWAEANGHGLDQLAALSDGIEAVVTKGGAAQGPATRPATPAPTCPSAPLPAPPAKMAIVVFSNDLDRALAALILANGFAATGTQVSLFFTFWGLSILRKNPAPRTKKTFLAKMFAWMLPCGAKKLALSKLDMMGLGRGLMKDLMRKQHVPSLDDLIASAHDAGVKFLACEMAMNLMGFSADELAPVDEVVGVATFAAVAKASGTLFI